MVRFSALINSRQARLIHFPATPKKKQPGEFVANVCGQTLTSSNRALSPWLPSLILTRKGFGYFETVMQTRDEGEGLHQANYGNFRKFSQPLPPFLPECLDEII